MRIETTIRTLYKYDELSNDAKENARDWYRDASQDDNFYAESIYEDAANIADLFGLNIRTRPAKRMDGSTTYEPSIYYSGFYSQGDGACYEGNYQYKPGALKAVKDYAPKDEELHRIAKVLQDAQQKHFYKLRATTKQRGYYYHSGCMDVDVWHEDDQYRDLRGADDDIRDTLRSFADWIYSRLEAEYELLMSDDTVEENIVANEYEFTESGHIA